MSKTYSEFVNTSQSNSIMFAQDVLKTLMQTNPELIRQSTPPQATPEDIGKALAKIYFSFIEATTTGKVE